MAKTNGSLKKSTRKSKIADSVSGEPQQPLHIGVVDTTVDSGSVIVADPGGDALDDLIASLEEPAASFAPIESDVVIEDSHGHAGHSDDTLEAAVMGAEAIEASLALATPEGVVEAGAVPTGTESDVQPEPAAEAAKPKRTPVPRKFYSNKADRLKDRMGDSLVEYTVLTMADAGVTDEELKAKMDETLAIIAKMNKKEQNRASMFIEFIAGKKAKPNEVLDRTLKVLARDGFISTGKEGNVYLDLLKKPYSEGAARAMGGNTISMLADLKVLNADGKQKFVANPESLLLMKANTLLFGDAAGEEAPAGAGPTSEPVAEGAAA